MVSGINMMLFGIVAHNCRPNWAVDDFLGANVLPWFARRIV